MGKNPISYASYLKLDAILTAQSRESGEGESAAHDEMLFIIIHQAYELWFKQIIHELKSIHAIMNADRIDERSMRLIVHRLTRVKEIQKVLIQQVSILETMTPMEFMEFRHLLGTASGFQSAQFRIVEVMLGLPDAQREEYGGHRFIEMLEPSDRNEIERLQEQPSLFDLIEKWLRRNPFLDVLWQQFRSVVDRYTDGSAYSISADAYDLLFNAAKYEEQRTKGEKRLSYEAAKSALFIMLYRDEPIFHLPYQLLEALVDVDELFTRWRFRHALMVQRMIGMKIGTGGSKGYDYLVKTTMRHRVFEDLATLSTYLIPPDQLPALTDEVRRQLGFAHEAG